MTKPIQVLSILCAALTAPGVFAQDREFFFEGQITSIFQNQSTYLSSLGEGDLFTGRIVAPVADLRLNETVVSRNTLIEVFFDAGPVRWMGDSTFIRLFDEPGGGGGGSGVGDSLSFGADAGGSPVVLLDEPTGFRPLNFGIDLIDPSATVLDGSLPDTLDLSPFSRGLFTLSGNFGGGPTSSPSEPVSLFGSLTRFSTVIPEPSSVMVLSGVGLLLMRRVRP